MINQIDQSIQELIKFATEKNGIMVNKERLVRLLKHRFEQWLSVFLLFRNFEPTITVSYATEKIKEALESTEDRTILDDETIPIFKLIRQFVENSTSEIDLTTNNGGEE